MKKTSDQKASADKSQVEAINALDTARDLIGTLSATDIDSQKSIDDLIAIATLRVAKKTGKSVAIRSGTFAILNEYIGIARAYRKILAEGFTFPV